MANINNREALESSTNDILDDPLSPINFDSLSDTLDGLNGSPRLPVLEDPSEAPHQIYQGPSDGMITPLPTNHNGDTFYQAFCDLKKPLAQRALFTGIPHGRTTQAHSPPTTTARLSESDHESSRLAVRESHRTNHPKNLPQNGGIRAVASHQDDSNGHTSDSFKALCRGVNCSITAPVRKRPPQDFQVRKRQCTGAHRRIIEGVELIGADSRYVLVWLPLRGGVVPRGRPKGNDDVEVVMQQLCHKSGSLQGFPRPQDVRLLLNDERVRDKLFCVQLDDSGRKKKMKEDDSWMERQHSVFEMKYQADAKDLKRWFKTYLKSANIEYGRLPLETRDAATRPRRSPSRPWTRTK